MPRLWILILFISFLSFSWADGQDVETEYLPITLENVDLLEQIAVLEFDLDGDVKAISQLSFHPTQPQLFSQEFNETVRVWNIETFEFIEALPLPVEYSTAFALSPDGEALIYGGWDFEQQPDFATINLWDLQSSVNSQLIRESQQSVDLIVFNHDGTMFATAGLPSQGQIQVWEPESETPIFETGYWNDVYQMAFTADNQLITAGQNREVSQIDVWNLDIQEPENTIDGYFFSLHPSEPIMLVTNSESPDYEPLTVEFNLDELDVPIERDFDGVPFHSNPTGEVVAVSSDDGVWLCDFETGEKLFKLRDYGSHVIAFSPDNRFIATVNGLGSITVWGIPAV